MDEDRQKRLEGESRRAVEAKRLLEDPILVKGFEDLEAALDRAWRNSKVQDSATRERAYMMLACLAELKGHLTRAIQTGRLAEIELAPQASGEGG
jgi:hypothetical protein